MALDFVMIDALAPVIVSSTAVVTAGYVVNTWLRMGNGYPLENSLGKSIHPNDNAEAQTRVQLLRQEYARRRAEIGAVKDRLANVERIVTDQGYDVARQIEGLRQARHEVTQR